MKSIKLVHCEKIISAQVQYFLHTQTNFVEVPNLIS